jgi:hypothetical protein
MIMSSGSGQPWRLKMSQRKPARPSDLDPDAKVTRAVIDAQEAPPGPERTKALQRAQKLRNAADIYNCLFSSELKPPE